MPGQALCNIHTNQRTCSTSRDGHHPGLVTQQHMQTVAVMNLLAGCARSQSWHLSTPLELVCSVVTTSQLWLHMRPPIEPRRGFSRYLGSYSRHRWRLCVLCPTVAYQASHGDAVAVKGGGQAILVGVEVWHGIPPQLYRTQQENRTMSFQRPLSARPLLYGQACRLKGREDPTAWEDIWSRANRANRS